MPAAVPTSKDGWPNVRALLDLRRFSLIIHLSVNLIAVLIMVLVTVITLSPTVTAARGFTLGALLPQVATPDVPPTANAATPLPPKPGGQKPEKEKPPEPNWLDQLWENFPVPSLLGILAVLVFEGVAHYQMKNAIHNHHTDIDKLVLPERTKCRGDSTNETDDKKKAMTEILESHQVRDYKDTWTLLNRQLACTALSFVAVSAVLTVLLATKDASFSMSLTGQVALLLFGKLIVGAFGLRLGEAERRVFPWREHRAG